ncbi:MAG: TraV family lipoprotein, partial [Alphaproteobacteria bacterium]|nr:TraV family lipoprotein [Alphaproteobacteria bacterium]
ATRSVSRRAVPAAALAALLLAGCSSGNVGESWQCPLADTGTCDSVAAADPAVPDAGAARTTVLAEPLWRVQDTRRPNASVEAPCDTACDGGFDPFGWLARLFAPETADREKTATSDPGRLLPPEAPTPSALLAEPDAPETHPEAEDTHGADLRTDEVVARIWIAPFVDADGVYREASHVRVVLEPAGWRLK